MEYSRERYVEKLTERMGDGLVKVITGTKMAGKSYLMNELFYRRLLDSGIRTDEIIRFAFDSDDDIDLLEAYFPEDSTRIRQRNGQFLVNSKKFRAYIRDKADGKERMFIMLDEVQLLEDFVGTVNSLNRHQNYDIYVTGSNSKFLSTDIATEFRGRGSVIHVLPLAFSEYIRGSSDKIDELWRDYIETGGIPVVAKMRSREERMDYLRILCEETYLKDIISRNGIRNPGSLSDVFNILASTVGSPVNPNRIANTFRTVLGQDITADTVSNYMRYFEEAFVLSRAMKYDVKGRKYIGSPFKIYFEDVGIRNVRLNFRQMEESHLMENIIYNELRYRGFNVDVGSVDINERTDRIDSNGRSIYAKKCLEVDYIATFGNRKLYIQSALSMSDPEKALQEKRPLNSIDDSFTKIVITKDNLNPYRDEKGVIIMGLFDFLVDEHSLDRL